MRPLPIVVGLAILTALGCANLAWTSHQGLGVDPLVAGVTLGFALLLLMAPWFLGVFKTQSLAQRCGECGQTTDHAWTAGFCMYCGRFLTKSAARASARRT